MSRHWAALLLLAAGLGEPALAAGSWVADAPAVRVAMVGREAASEVLAPPAGMTAERRIAEVRWRFRVPPGERVGARLCHPRGCVRLAGGRGTSQALAGMAAGEALRFHFERLPGQGPVTVKGLQVIVNYR
ncbi:flagellar protein FlhE [Halomonas nitroreducens]|uniref:Flagellar FlhE n=1 Tax=Halomonas nitroreducens TaxID=447425 RepID=A0A3S0K3Q8_9GAMM|nr:flagellar protein FlhE [Halomonas nitroreducens]RTR04442.1 flagellar FlhE [Halomonas nitroreducens]